MIAAIADHVHDLRHLVAMMLVSRHLYNGVSLSKRWALVLEVLAGEKDGEERRKILMSREQNLIYASRQCGHARHLRHAQLDQEEAFLCLPMACGSGQIECVRYLVTRFDIKDRPKHTNLVPDRDTWRPADGIEAFREEATKQWPGLFGAKKTTSIMACFTFACSSSEGLPVVKYLHEQCNVTSNDLRDDCLVSIFMACSFGRLDTLRYLYETGLLKADDIHSRMASEGSAFEAACRGGHLPVVQWFHDTFELKRDNIPLPLVRAFWLSAYHLPVVQYLHRVLALTPADAVQFGRPALMEACKYGQVSVVKYLRTKFPPSLDDVRLYLCWACTFGSLPIVKYLHTAFSLTAEDAMAATGIFDGAFVEACIYQKVDVVEYLHTMMGVTAEHIHGLAERVRDLIWMSVDSECLLYLRTIEGLTVFEC